MNNRMDVNAVLTQMRQVKQQLRDAQAHNPMTSDNAAQRLSQQVERLQQADAIGADQKIAADRNDVSAPAASNANAPDFQKLFKQAINQVNDNQKTASSLATRFEQGDPNVDLPEVMIALQKSSVSFQAMTQVRNKLVEAYKDVMNMPL